jgi:hypothetical protein
LNPVYVKINTYMPHRTIYKSYRGSIPKDEFGRTYDIHHLDGNHLNNLPENLQAVSIQEHFNIHQKQEDWGACYMLASKMKISPEEISRLASLAQQKRVTEGTHHWLLKNRVQTRPITEWEFENPIDYDSPLSEYQLASLEFSRELALEAFQKNNTCCTCDGILHQTSLT